MIAIIPARGQSKRIRRKNIKLFYGIPIIAYSIKAALDSNLFERVMVSTDDDEIAKIALAFGAEVPFMRSEENSTDFSTTADVINEVIASYKKINYSFEKACCLYPTAPLLTIDLLQECADVLEQEAVDSVFPIIKYGVPPQMAIEVNNGGNLTMVDPLNLQKRTQEMTTYYFDSGQFYFFKVSSFKVEGTILTDNSKGVVIDELQAQDLDNESDWKIAELKYKLLHNIED
jgi:pseudaminic acid cytidylyltransferase